MILFFSYASNTISYNAIIGLFGFVADDYGLTQSEVAIALVIGMIVAGLQQPFVS